MATVSTDGEITTVSTTAGLELSELSGLKRESKAAEQRREIDPWLVEFTQPYDEENPLDWPSTRKWLVTDVLSATGFNRIMVSTIMAPALPVIAAELNMNSTEAAMALSIYLLATAFGPLVIGPLSELYGRSVVLHVSEVWFLVWNLVCGFAQNKGTLIAARFLAGFGASAIYALAGGVLGDIWRPEERGRSLSIYLLIPLLGSAVGPILGGSIVAHNTWRWIFWATSAFQAFMIVGSLSSFHETYRPLILRRRAARVRQATGNERYHSASELIDGDRAATSLLRRSLTRSIRLLMNHRIIQVSSTLSGFNYGIMYITLTTFSKLWKTEYHESVEISGLHYLACALGEIAASQVGGYAMDYFYKRRHNPEPEGRLPLMYPGIALAWSGVLLYGWTANYHAFWFIVDMGVFIMMFGMQLGGLPMSAYIIDVYGEHASSALAAQQFMKSLLAFLFPLFAPSMYSALGYGWTNSVLALAGLCLAIPLPLFLWKYGMKYRTMATSPW